MVANQEVNDLREKTARLEERLAAADKALNIAVANATLAARVTVLEKILEHEDGRKKGTDNTWAFIFVGLGLVFGAIELILRWPK